MKHCETCIHWDDKVETWLTKRQVRECKNHEKLMEGFGDAVPDGLCYSYEEGGTFYTGPKFGCVHHKEKA